MVNHREEELRNATQKLYAATRFVPNGFPGMFVVVRLFSDLVLYFGAPSIMPAMTTEGVFVGHRQDYPFGIEVHVAWFDAAGPVLQDVLVEVAFILPADEQIKAHALKVGS